MASSGESWSYAIDVPEFIQRKVDLLHHQERQIVAIESQLKELKERHAELEAQLLPYRIINQLAPSENAAINRCPDEILIFIWWRLFDTDHPFWHCKHPSIRRLLLVCKRWFRLLMNTPTLWTRISILNTWALFHPCGEESQVPYISACIQRSQAAPFDVRLDLGEFPIRSEYIKKQILKLLFSICDKDEKNRIETHVQQWDTDFSSDLFETRFEQALKYLTGANLDAQRWDRLSLALPQSYEVVNHIWASLGGSFPNLTSLEIVSAPIKWAKDDQFLQNPPNIPMVKQLRLDLTCGAFPITTLNPSPSVLEHLGLSTDWDFSNIEELSLFKKLRTLELICTDRVPILGAFDIVDFPSIYLPCLATLSLVLIRSDFRAPDLNLPSLQTLKLVSKFANYALPKLSVRHVDWFMPWLSHDEVDYEGTVETKIREIVGLSSVLETLTIQANDKDAVCRAIMRMKKEGEVRLPAKILVEKQGHTLEAIHI